MSAEPGGSGQPSVAAFLPPLSAALAAFDGPAAERVCAELRDRLHDGDRPVPVAEATELLSVLRRSRRFELLRLVAEALLQTGVDAPVVRR